MKRRLAAFKSIAHIIRGTYNVEEADAKEVLVADFMSEDGRDRVDVQPDYDGPEKVYVYDSLLELTCYYKYFSKIPSWRPIAVSIQLFTFFIWHDVELTLLLTFFSFIR